MMTITVLSHRFMTMTDLPAFTIAAAALLAPMGLNAQAERPEDLRLMPHGARVEFQSRQFGDNWVEGTIYRSWTSPCTYVIYDSGGGVNGGLGLDLVNALRMRGGEWARLHGVWRVTEEEQDSVLLTAPEEPEWIAMEMDEVRHDDTRRGCSSW